MINALVLWSSKSLQHCPAQNTPMPDMTVRGRADREVVDQLPRPGKASEFCADEQDSDLDGIAKEISMQKKSLKWPSSKRNNPYTENMATNVNHQQ